MDTKLMRVADVAKVLSVSRSTAYELIARGEIPSVRLGGSLRIPVLGLEAKLAQLQRGAVPPAA